MNFMSIITILSAFIQCIQSYILIEIFVSFLLYLASCTNQKILHLNIIKTVQPKEYVIIHLKFHLVCVSSCAAFCYIIYKNPKGIEKKGTCITIIYYAFINSNGDLIEFLNYPFICYLKTKST